MGHRTPGVDEDRTPECRLAGQDRARQLQAAGQQGLAADRAAAGTHRRQRAVAVAPHRIVATGPKAQRVRHGDGAFLDNLSALQAGLAVPAVPNRQVARDPAVQARKRPADTAGAVRLAGSHLDSPGDAAGGQQDAVQVTPDPVVVGAQRGGGVGAAGGIAHHRQVVGLARLQQLGKVQPLDARRVLGAAQPQPKRQHHVGVALDVVDLHAEQVAVEALTRMGLEVARPLLAVTPPFELVVGDHRQAQQPAVGVLQRGARAGVVADAQADRDLLKRHLDQPQAHHHGRSLLRVGVEADAHGLEQPGLLQAILVVLQAGFGQRRASAKAGQVQHGGFVVVVQAVDLEAAGQKQRPAVQRHAQGGALGGGVDHGLAVRQPGRGIARSEQARQQPLFGLDPVAVAKRLADPTVAAVGQRLEQGLGLDLAQRGAALQVTGGLDLQAGDLGARARHHGQGHALQGRRAGAVHVAAHGHLGVEIALGLQQLTRLPGCCRGQARPLFFVDHLVAAQQLQARQVQVRFQQGLQLARRLHVQAQARDRHVCRGDPVGQRPGQQRASAEHRRDGQQAQEPNGQPTRPVQRPSEAVVAAAAQCRGHAPWVIWSAGAWPLPARPASAGTCAG